MKHKLILAIFFIIGFSRLYSQNDIVDCSSCQKEKLFENQLKNKTVEELRLLRNEIYARNGYSFENQQFYKYFENKEWYKPLDSNNEIELSSIETQNINLIKKIEKKEKEKREKALNQLKEIKFELNNKNIEAVNKYISERKLTQQWKIDYQRTIEELKFFLNKIDLNDIHWNKKFGYYNHSIDNGYSITSYKLVFSNNEIRIGGGMYSHSENFGDFDDGYSDYMSEGENQSFWIFKITINGIEFDHLEILG